MSGYTPIYLCRLYINILRRFKRDARYFEKAALSGNPLIRKAIDYVPKVDPHRRDRRPRHVLDDPDDCFTTEQRAELEFDIEFRARERELKRRGKACAGGLTGLSFSDLNLDEDVVATARDV
jgi:hypothetical protein